jgi:hypothetical protein
VRQALGEGVLWNLAHKSHVTGWLSVPSTVVVHCAVYLALTDRKEGPSVGILKSKVVSHQQHIGLVCMAEEPEDSVPCSDYVFSC